MARSPEEREANEAIEAAIEQYRAVWQKYHPESQEGTLVDWIVVAADTKPDLEDSSDDVTSYSIIMPKGGMPWYRARGLLEAGIEYMSGMGERTP